MWEGKLVVVVAGWFSEEEFGYNRDWDFISLRNFIDLGPQRK